MQNESGILEAAARERHWRTDGAASRDSKKRKSSKCSALACLLYDSRVVQLCLLVAGNRKAVSVGIATVSCNNLRSRGARLSHSSGISLVLEVSGSLGRHLR